MKETTRTKFAEFACDEKKRWRKWFWLFALTHARRDAEEVIAIFHSYSYIRRGGIRTRRDAT